MKLLFKIIIFITLTPLGLLFHIIGFFFALAKDAFLAGIENFENLNDWLHDG